MATDATPARASPAVSQQHTAAGRSASVSSSTDASLVSPTSTTASTADTTAAAAVRKKRTSNVFWTKLNFTVKTARLQSLKRHKYQHLQEEALLKARGLLKRWEDGPVLLIEDLYRQAAGGGSASEDELRELRNYTPEALALRFSLRNDPRVLDAVKELWTIDTGPRDALGCIDQRAYTALFRRIAKCVNAEALPKQRRRRRERVDKTIHEDWTRDSKGEREMSFAAFFDSVFELADLWCETIDVDEYVTFLASVRDRISERCAKRTRGGGSGSRQRVLRSMRRVKLLDEELSDESESSTSEDESADDESESESEAEEEDAEPEETPTGNDVDETPVMPPLAHSSLMHRFLTEKHLTESSNGSKQQQLAALSHKTNSTAGALGSRQQPLRIIKSANSASSKPSSARSLSAAYHQQQLVRQLERHRQSSVVDTVRFRVDDNNSSGGGSDQFLTTSTSSSSSSSIDLSALIEGAAFQLPVAAATTTAAVGGGATGSRKSLQQIKSIHESGTGGDSAASASTSASPSSFHHDRHALLLTATGESNKTKSGAGWAVAVAAAVGLEAPPQRRSPPVAVHVVESGIDGIVNSSSAVRSAIVGNTAAVTTHTRGEPRGTPPTTSAVTRRLLAPDTRIAIINLTRPNATKNTLLAASVAGFQGVVASAMHSSGARAGATAAHHDAFADGRCLGSIVGEQFHAPEASTAGAAGAAGAVGAAGAACATVVAMPSTTPAGSVSRGDMCTASSTGDRDDGSGSSSVGSAPGATTWPPVLEVNVHKTLLSPPLSVVGDDEEQRATVDDALVQQAPSGNSVAISVRVSSYYSYGASVRPSSQVVRMQARGGSTATQLRPARERARVLPRMMSPIQQSAYRFSKQGGDGDGDDEASHSNGTPGAGADGRLDLSSSYTAVRYVSDASKSSSLNNTTASSHSSVRTKDQGITVMSSLDVTASSLSTSAAPFWHGLGSVRTSADATKRVATRARTKAPPALQRFGIYSDAADDGSCDSAASGSQEPQRQRQRQRREQQHDAVDSDPHASPWDTFDDGDDDDAFGGRNWRQSDHLSTDDRKPPTRSPQALLSPLPTQSQRQSQPQQRTNRPHNSNNNVATRVSISALQSSPLIVTSLSGGAAFAYSGATGSCALASDNTNSCNSSSGKGGGHTLASAATASMPAIPTLTDEHLHARTLGSSHSEALVSLSLSPHLASPHFPQSVARGKGFDGWRDASVAPRERALADLALRGERKAVTRSHPRESELGTERAPDGVDSVLRSLSPLYSHASGTHGRTAGGGCVCSRSDPRANNRMFEHCEATARIRMQTVPTASSDCERRPQSPVFKMERHSVSHDARAARIALEGDCSHHQQCDCCAREVADDVTILLNATREIILRPRRKEDEVADEARRHAPTRSEMMKRRCKYTFGKV